jgi:hypothetical protein
MSEMKYSPFFEVLHDERGPVGELGRGTHYSVLRVPAWQDSNFEPVRDARLLDFAVIWDEDHDERVIEVVEDMYFQGLLAPVRFIGERKGSLSVLVERAVLESWKEREWCRYCDCVSAIAQSLEDPWTVKVDAIYDPDHRIIQASFEDVSIYLKNIDLLWRLGLKPRDLHVNRGRMERAAEQRSATQRGRVLETALTAEVAEYLSL